MVATPEILAEPAPLPPKPEVQMTAPERNPLERIFTLGYVESPIIEIYKDDLVELKAKFRTLLPLEIRDVTELVSRFSSTPAQLVTERIETLARSIIHINYMPLILDKDDQENYFRKHGRNPSPLDMARAVLSEKIKSMVVIDALYTAYIEFTNEVFQKFEDAKKKPNVVTSQESVPN